MPTRTLLHRARAVVTLQGPAGPRAGAAMGALAVLEHGSVAIDDSGRIAWVGPGDRVPHEHIEGVETIDCRDRTITPALVDPHTHAVWAGDRKDELELRIAGADYEEIFAKGEAKGLAEGEAKGRVKDILVLLAIRGIALTPKLRRRLHECTDLDRLDRWFRNAATAESIEAVFSVEGSPPSSSSKAVRRPAASRSRVRERPRA